MKCVISGGTIIDGTGGAPLVGGSLVIDGERIVSVNDCNAPESPGMTQIDAKGKYVIPGLMNANVHLLVDIRLENLARYTGHYDDLIGEAAQVALKNGLTTVFDTWGPRRFLMTVRDRINSGDIPGSRIFCAGNIIGIDGPYSPDFSGKAAEVASAAFVRRINAIWVENVGRHLMWLPPQQVANEVRAYIGKGIDFVKYASNEHFGTSAGAFLAFSPAAQAAIVGEAHRAGLTAQAHTTSVEGLRVAVEAGCNLIQHANLTGPIPIPESTLELLTTKNVGAVIFPFTQRALAWIMENVARETERTMFKCADVNARNLIRAGATLLLANDGSLFAPEVSTDPLWSKSWHQVPEEENNLLPLATGHFAWFRAMEEMGCPPMQMLCAATRNIARAYGKDKELGTLEPGKIADIVVLDKNPLLAAENYRSIHMILKEGRPVDRASLPSHAILTRNADAPIEEEASYVPALESRLSFPICPMCMPRH